jgi:hypothetical protein
MTLNERATFDLAVRLRSQGAPIGEVFSFISGLYFRGKVAYSQAFSAPPEGVCGAFVITGGRGLVRLEQVVSIAELREIAAIPVEASEPRFREPLEREAAALEREAGPDCDVVLLGSVATAKYVDPLLAVFGDRLLFPEEFAGRGDMSRGGLMLRCARDGLELNYVAVAGAKRRGPRPPRLAPVARKQVK